MLSSEFLPPGEKSLLKANVVSMLTKPIKSDIKGKL